MHTGALPSSNHGYRVAYPSHAEASPPPPPVLTRPALVSPGLLTTRGPPSPATAPHPKHLLGLPRMTEQKHGSNPAASLTQRDPSGQKETVPTMPLYKAHRPSRHRRFSHATLARWLSRRPSQRQHRILLPCVLRYQPLQDVRCRALQLCTTNTTSKPMLDPLAPITAHPPQPNHCYTTTTTTCAPCDPAPP